MATGDLNNNIDKARNELTSIRYDGAWNSLGIAEGAPEAYLPLIHHVCISFSRFLARFLASKGYELMGKNDMRFMEEVYKILRNEFNYRPALNLSQFFTVGFAERKLILVCDLIKLCKRKHNEISKQKADAKRKTVSSPSPSLLRPPSPQVNASKKDFEPESSLRKSGGSLNKSGTGLDGSQRRRSASTGSANTTPTVPKKFVASTSLVNNEIDVVDFRPNVSAARPPIRVIRNEPKQSAESPTPIHINHTSSSTPSRSHTNHTPSNSFSSPAPPPSYAPPTPNNGSTYPSSSYTSPANFSNIHYSTPTSFYPNASASTPSSVLPANPSLSSIAPLPSSSAYASRNADGSWRMQDGHANRYATSETKKYSTREKEDVMEIEDVDQEEGEEEEDEGAEEPAVFREFRTNGRLEGGEINKQDNGISGASTGIGMNGEVPITDKVAMQILDKLVQMETKVLSSITNLQTSMVSLESRVKNLESLLGDTSPKRAIHQPPQQPTLTTNTHKHTINYHNTPQEYKVSNHTTSNPVTTSHSLNYSSHPTHTSHSPPSHTANFFGDEPKSFHYQTKGSPTHEQYNFNENNNIHNSVHNSPNGYHDTSDNSSSNSEKERPSYKPTSQSTQDFISSITKRFRDTRELLSKQHNQQLNQLSSSYEHK